MLRSRWFRYVLVFAIAAGSIGSWMRPTPVEAGNPLLYAHSYYMRSTSTTLAQSLGESDGLRDDDCGDHIVVLNFGQITKEAAPGRSYEGYGTYTFAAGAPYVNDSQIVAAARAYAYGWWHTTAQYCAKLKLAIGVNNYKQCPAGFADTDCTRGRAGYNWAWAVSNVQTYINTTSTLATQITAAAADDIETGYDTYYSTKLFVDGYNNQAPLTQAAGAAKFYDFGDAFPNASWTLANIHYVAWGAPSNYPLPLMFLQGWADTWTDVKQYDTSVVFQGVMTECNVQSDELPTGYCQVSNGIASQEFSPNLAWTTFRNALSASGVPVATFSSASNIRNQP